MNPIDRAPMAITAYSCCVCGHWHRVGSKKFKAHYAPNAAKNGWRDFAADPAKGRVEDKP